MGKGASRVFSLLCLPLIMLACGWASDDTNPSGRSRIAFASDRNGHYDVYVMNSDGSGQKRLTGSVYEETQPSWSSDGLKLVFTRSGQLLIMSAEGEDETTIRNTEQIFAEYPDWSTREDRIVFVAQDLSDFSASIVSVNSDGTELRTLFSDCAHDCMEPRWSNDGARIAFVRDDEGLSESQIYVMDANGENARGVTALLEGQPVGSPTWSPDDQSILFSRASDATRASLRLMTTDLAGNERQLAGRGYWSSWSPPDLGKIVFDSLEGGSWKIYVMNADGSGQTRIVDHGANNEYPAWSPR